MNSDALTARFAALKLVVCDVDGTLTNGGMYYAPTGELLKRFDTRDGHGIGLLRDAGIEVAFVTGEDSPIVPARAEKLGVELVILGSTDKSEDVRNLQRRLTVKEDETAFIGDDLGDLAGFAACGVRLAVNDAVAEIKAKADYVTLASGGHGAVREIADMILKAKESLSHDLIERQSPGTGLF